jgi:hypothetical protein
VVSQDQSLTDGPILLQDSYLIEQRANFNRERIFVGKDPSAKSLLSAASVRLVTAPMVRAVGDIPHLTAADHPGHEIDKAVGRLPGRMSLVRGAPPLSRRAAEGLHAT